MPRACCLTLLISLNPWFGQACGENLPAPNAMSRALQRQQTDRPQLEWCCLKFTTVMGLFSLPTTAAVKGQQIAENPRVSLLFPWFSMGRQVTVTGIAQRIPTAASLRYFLFEKPGKSARSLDI
ncbi:MAG: hypothetical protein Ct9H300mP14_07460 [Gammaproteobacteria bacterium]|nr:MAG: hypothetical protein Ct9H300mP14_07460 [Gammaproteobacteria bacterium]